MEKLFAPSNGVHFAPLPSASTASPTTSPMAVSQLIDPFVSPTTIISVYLQFGSQREKVILERSERVEVRLLTEKLGSVHIKNMLFFSNFCRRIMNFFVKLSFSSNEQSMRASFHCRRALANCFYFDTTMAPQICCNDFQILLNLYVRFKYRTLSAFLLYFAG